MALEAGVVSVTVEFAQGLRDHDWFGKQDPYVIVRCGAQQFRSRTAVDGGRNPVWNQTFQFNVINDNAIDILLKDEDVLSRDDVIGTARVDMYRCRMHGVDHLQVPVIQQHRNTQRGFVSVTLQWTPNYRHGGYGGQPAPMPYGMSPQGYPGPSQGYQGHAPAPYPAPQPYNGMSPAGYPPSAPYPSSHGYPAASHATPQYAPAGYAQSGTGSLLGTLMHHAMNRH